MIFNSLKFPWFKAHDLSPPQQPDPLSLRSPISSSHQLELPLVKLPIAYEIPTFRLNRRDAEIPRYDERSDELAGRGFLKTVGIGFSVDDYTEPGSAEATTSNEGQLQPESTDATTSNNGWLQRLLGQSRLQPRERSIVAESGFQMDLGSRWELAHEVVSLSLQTLDNIIQNCMNWRLLPDLCQARRDVCALKAICPREPASQEDMEAFAANPFTEPPENAWPMHEVGQQRYEGYFEQGPRGDAIRPTPPNDRYLVRLGELLRIVLALNHIHMAQRYYREDFDPTMADGSITPYKLGRPLTSPDKSVYAYRDAYARRLCSIFEISKADRDLLKIPEDFKEQLRLLRNFHSHGEQACRAPEAEPELFAEQVLERLGSLQTDLFASFQMHCQSLAEDIRSEVCNKYWFATSFVAGDGEHLEPDPPSIHLDEDEMEWRQTQATNWL